MIIPNYDCETGREIDVENPHYEGVDMGDDHYIREMGTRDSVFHVIGLCNSRKGVHVAEVRDPEIVAEVDTALYEKSARNLMTGLDVSD